MDSSVAKAKGEVESYSIGSEEGFNAFDIGRDGPIGQAFSLVIADIFVNVPDSRARREYVSVILTA